jgi:hypothetical protein
MYYSYVSSIESLSVIWKISGECVNYDKRSCVPGVMSDVTWVTCHHRWLLHLDTWRELGLHLSGFV